MSVFIAVIVAVVMFFSAVVVGWWAHKWRCEERIDEAWHNGYLAGALDADRAKAHTEFMEGR